MPSEIGCSESGWPITPVEATATSSSRMPVYSRTSAHMPSAISMPFALQVFALPLFTITARA